MTTCDTCNRDMKKVLACGKCSHPVCRTCVVMVGKVSYCKECNPLIEDKNLVMEYFKDKYTVPSMRIIFMLLLMFILSFNVSAIEFKTLSYKQDLTSFDWTFLSPYDGVKTLSSSDFQLYVDKMSGCNGVTTSLCVDRVYESVKTECTYTQECSVVKRDFFNNKTLKNETLENNNCISIPNCKNVTVKNVVCESLKDSSKSVSSSFVVNTDMFFHLKGTRKAQTGYQSCDLNFKDLSSSTPYDTKAFGFAWWNVTFNTRYNITLFGNSYFYNYTNYPVLLTLNTSALNCLSNGGDVRFADNSGNEINYNLSVWNVTTGLIYVNMTMNSTNNSFFLYCNATIPLNTTSKPFKYLELSQGLVSFYRFDNGTGGLLDALGNVSLIGVGTVPNRTGYNNNSRGAYTSAQYFSTGAGITISPGDSFTQALWIYHANTNAGNHVMLSNGKDDASGGYQHTIYLDQTTNKVSIRRDKFGAGVDTATTTNTCVQYAWCLIIAKYDASNTTLSISINNSGVGTDTSYSIGGAVGGNVFRIGYNFAPAFGDWSASNLYVDEVGNWNRALSDTETSLLLQNPPGTVYPFYVSAQGSVSNASFNIVASSVSGVLLTDSKTVIVSNNISEGQEFYVGANYSYVVNSSAVIGNCTFNMTNASEENYNYTTGVNTTIFGATTQSFVHTFTHDGSFVGDQYKFKWCHVGIPQDVIVKTNCTGESITVPAGAIPLCSNSYVNYTIASSRCNSTSSIQLNVSSTGSSSVKALRIVDSFNGVDRFLNLTNHNMTFDPAIQLYTSIYTWEYYTHGNYSDSIECHQNSPDVYNGSAFLNFFVMDLTPVSRLSSAWWWLLNETPISFDSPGIVGKYPLVSTVNFTVDCTASPVDTLKIFVNYTNGTNIYSFSKLVNSDNGDFQVNLSSGNFSVNSNRNVQVWCNSSAGVSTFTKFFNSSNLQPLAQFNNASGGLYSVSPVYSYTCSDPELESLNGYLFTNGSLISSVSPLVSGAENLYSMVYADGYWYNDLVCQDSFFNSSNATVSFTKINTCVVGLFGIVDGGRYLSTELSVGLNCSNGVVLSDCWWSTNQYSYQILSNCSGNISVERGSNTLVFMVDDGFNTTTSMTIQAKDLNLNVFDFVLLWVYLFVYVLCLLTASFTRIPAFNAVSLIPGFLLGFEVMTLSFYGGCFVIALSVFVAIVLIFNE